MTTDFKLHLAGNVTFQYFRDGQLFYKTDSGLVFPVNADDTDKGTFLAQDRAIYFMRYIRKFLVSLEAQ